MKLATNYHTHTKRCNHASGEDRDYVLAGIDAGLRVLGFSDHMPWPKCAPGVAHSRMAMAKLEDYFTSLTKLKDEYKNDIEIHIGFEAENFDQMDEMLRLLEPYPCEYLLLGHHFTGYGDHEHYFGRPFSEPELLENYTSNVIRGIESGRFLYVAHPDLPCFQGDKALWTDAMTRICTAAKAADMALEVNALGFRGHRNYPTFDFFRMAADMGCTFCIGLDAHSPEQVNDPENTAAVIAFAEQFGAPIRTEFQL